MPDPNRLITQLALSVNTYWRLYKADLFTVAKVVELTPREALDLLGSRAALDELRRAIRQTGYADPWPELDLNAGAALSPATRTLALRPDIEKALIENGLRTLARILGTPADDMLDFLSWEQCQELRRRLIELGHAEPGDAHQPS